jgi:hypothetical protein
MLQFQSGLLSLRRENVEIQNRPWNEDFKQSMEMSGGLLCSLRDVCQDHLHQQHLHLVLLQLLLQMVPMKVQRLLNVLCSNLPLR